MTLMSKKTFAPGGRVCRVTFELPAGVRASSAALTGEFNGWKPVTMVRRKDGRFSITLSLPTGRSYRYRFILDGERWENDWAAEGYADNGHGGEDSVVHC
jgi:1,4-alpha-glucan branching enzyme